MVYSSYIYIIYISKIESNNKTWNYIPIIWHQNNTKIKWNNLKVLILKHKMKAIPRSLDMNSLIQQNLILIRFIECLYIIDPWKLAKRKIVSKIKNYSGSIGQLCNTNRLVHHFCSIDRSTFGQPRYNLSQQFQGTYTLNMRITHADRTLLTSTSKLIYKNLAN